MVSAKVRKLKTTQPAHVLPLPSERVKKHGKTASERSTGIRRSDWLRWFSDKMQCYEGTRVSVLRKPSDIQEQVQLLRKGKFTLARFIEQAKQMKGGDGEIIKWAENEQRKLVDKLNDLTKAAGKAATKQSRTQARKRQERKEAMMAAKAKKEAKKKARLGAGTGESIAGWLRDQIIKNPAVTTADLKPEALKKFPNSAAVANNLSTLVWQARDKLIREGKVKGGDLAGARAGKKVKKDAAKKATTKSKKTGKAGKKTAKVKKSSPSKKSKKAKSKKAKKK